MNPFLSLLLLFKWLAKKEKVAYSRKGSLNDLPLPHFHSHALGPGWPGQFPWCGHHEVSFRWCCRYPFLYYLVCKCSPVSWWTVSERSPAVPKKTKVHQRAGETGTQLSTALAWDGFKRIEMKHHTPLKHRGATRRTGRYFTLCACSSLIPQQK